MKKLTMIEFTPEVMAQAEAMAEKLGYAGNYAYTSTSALIGLFCMAHNPARPENRRKAHRDGCIINTAELGLMFVQLAEDLED